MMKVLLTLLITSSTTTTALAPQRLSDNANGPLFVNDKCINCAACSMFAPTVFGRSDQQASHIVTRQPSSRQELNESQAALRACPVAAIRLETNAFRNHNKLTPLLPQEEKMVKAIADTTQASFPRQVSLNFPNVHFVGHHNSASFGAAPYLLHTNQYGWILIDSPKYSKSAVRAIESLTGPDGPAFLVLTHVDDTAHHGKWKDQYPNLKRIFHEGDLGRHNWIGDETLEKVEVLQTSTSTHQELQFMTLNGESLPKQDLHNHEVVVVHTPGHSPGSLTLWKLPSCSSSSCNDGILFTGDTYSYTTRNGGHMTGFPRYGNDLGQQAQTLKLLQDLDWSLIAPGHGHVRDYTTLLLSSSSSSSSSEDHHTTTKGNLQQLQVQEMQAALEELMNHS